MSNYFLIIVCGANLHKSVCVCVRTAAQVSCEDVLGGDEQLLAEVSGLRRAVRKKLQHTLYQLLRVFPYHVLTGRRNTQNMTYVGFYHLLSRSEASCGHQYLEIKLKKIRFK